MPTPQEKYLTIPLTRGQVALISEEDYEQVTQFKWYALKERRGNFYAARSIAKGKIEMMHRLICQTPPGMVTDHINRDTIP